MDFLWSRKAFSGPVSTPPFSSASPGCAEVRVAADQTAGQPQGGPDDAEQSRQDRQAGRAQGTEAAEEGKSAAGGQPAELPVTLRSRERGRQLAWPLEGGGHASYEWCRFVWIVFPLFGLCSPCLNCVLFVWIVFPLFRLCSLCLDCVPLVWIVFPLFGLVDSLIDLLIEWLTYWSTQWLFDSLVDDDQLTDWVIDLIGWMLQKQWQ